MTSTAKGSGSTETVGLSTSGLSQSRRKMLDLVNKLYNTGVQVDLSLPQIVAIGSQSSGKSSLIEGMSGVALPRAAGTCTRCPIECRLTRADTPWQCIVSITRSSTPNTGGPQKVSFGPPIFDPKDVEERVRRAQHAVLHPKEPLSTSLNINTQTYHNARFTADGICLEISGPNVADLSFCDLPGLIATAADEKEGAGTLVETVQATVEKYIQNPRCIILVVVACETDFENQGAYALAKKYDPSGSRTIGVLTKPDRIPQLHERLWMPYLHNTKSPLVHGWFMVKQPNSVALEGLISYQSAREEESHFFASKAPWSTLPSSIRHQLGTPNLVEKLSGLLSDMMRQQLPLIQQDIDNAIEVVQNDLGSLPAAPSKDPGTEVNTLLFQFASSLKSEIQGTTSDRGIHQAIRSDAESFRRAIRYTAPNFRPYNSAGEGFYQLEPAPFLIEMEEEDFEGCQDLFKSSASHPQDKINRPKIFIDQVMKRAQNARSRELPGTVPFAVNRGYIQAFVQEWRQPASVFCAAVYQELRARLDALIEQHFGSYGLGTLKRSVMQIAHNHLSQCQAAAQGKIWEQLEAENEPHSFHYRQGLRKNLLDYYTKERRRFLDPKPNLSTPTTTTTASGNHKHKKKTVTPTASTAPQPQPPTNLFTFPYPVGAASGSTTTATAGSTSTSTGSESTAPSKAEAAPTPAPTSFFSQGGFFTGKPSTSDSSTATTSFGVFGQPVPPANNPEGIAAFQPQTTTATSSTWVSAFPPVSTTSSSSSNWPPPTTNISQPGAPDPAEPALVIMADVRAYFQIAYQRYTDNIYRAIDMALVQGVEKGLFSDISSSLGIHGPNGHEVCKQLAMEDPAVSQKREELQAKLASLKAASSELAYSSL